MYRTHADEVFAFWLIWYGQYLSIARTIYGAQPYELNDELNS